mmetsp:Transcript_18889/g.27325  ORF Transcript_18889/g.27325 Transcript_18889/m.27325 type:complete len:135 (-) Transcript_18889:491-895(-)
MSLLAKSSGVLTRVVRRSGVRSMGAATNDPSQMMTPTKPPVSVAAESEYIREIPKWPLGYDSECFHTVEHGRGRLHFQQAREFFHVLVFFQDLVSEEKVWMVRLCCSGEAFFFPEASSDLGLAFSLCVFANGLS